MLLIVFKQVAVVAREFDDKALGSKSALDDALLDIVLRMLEQRVGEGGEVGIVSTEEFARRNGLEDLNESADLTEYEIERIARLGPVELVGGQ